jgi:hypothetical protein
MPSKIAVMNSTPYVHERIRLSPIEIMVKKRLNSRKKNQAECPLAY